MSKENEFRQELESLLNIHCQENFSNTPDWILAKYLLNCLINFNEATRSRDDYYEVTLSPGDCYFGDKPESKVLKNDCSSIDLKYVDTKELTKENKNNGI